ncbi:MAG: type III pantothenate kinase [Acetivibrionales bacterium]
MLLVANIGNTNMRFGIYEGRKLLAHWKLSTNKEWTSDEFGMHFVNFFNYNNLDISEVENIIIASVVPPIMYSFENAIRKYLKKIPILVGPGIKTGINIKYENPRELGADRIVSAVAAYEIYGGPVIVVDFGTATTFNAISSKGEFLGGVICPGIKISAEALYQRTAKLPKIDLTKHETVIARNTLASIQSGVFHGYVGQVNHLVNKIKKEMKEEGIKVIATGGLARFIASEADVIDEVNRLLALEGLRIIYEKNRIDA